MGKLFIVISDEAEQELRSRTHRKGDLSLTVETALRHYFTCHRREETWISD